MGHVEPVMAGLLEPGQHVPHLLAEGHPQATKSYSKRLRYEKSQGVKQQLVVSKNYKWQLVNRIIYVDWRRQNTLLILLRNVFKTAGRVKYGCRAMSMFSGLIRNVQRT